jgi:glucose-1-phosphate adenylyltransferase
MQRGWNFLRTERNESFDILPASQRVSEDKWYMGTADAVFQNIDIIDGYGPEYLLILAGDHVYKMDYERMLVQHVNSGADVTVGCVEVPLEDAKGFGIMHVGEQGRILDFFEKPPQPPEMPDKPGWALASMGIYVFKRTFLNEQLRRDAADPQSSRDFGKDIIPYLVKHGKAVAHRFTESCVRGRAENEVYWRDVGTIDAYWEANIDLTATKPLLNLYDTDWPIWTWQEQLPPAKFVHNEPDRRGLAIESTVSGGCIISGALYRSLLFSKCRVHSYSHVNWSVLLPSVEVGRKVRLNKVVVDRGCVLPDELVVGEDPDSDAQRFHRTEGGVTLITREMLDRLA